LSTTYSTGIIILATWRIWVTWNNSKEVRCLCIFASSPSRMKLPCYPLSKLEKITSP
jgi:hypothetical protein